MILGIDATNIRSGGGLTHLREIINFSDINSHGFDKVVIWSSQQTLNLLPNEEWLVKISHEYLNKSFVWSFLYQVFILGGEANKHDCSLVFVPGGTFISSFRPFVTMSQNMLPFELHEAFRFKSFLTRTRFLILRITQSYSFKKAEGVIFLTKYAHNAISSILNLKKKPFKIISHGIDKKFSSLPKAPMSPDFYNSTNPFKLLYVSIVTAYKHQWNVAEAVCKLNERGYPLHLDLIGPKDEEGFSKLKAVLDRYPNSKSCISYLGKKDHRDLFDYYRKSDAFVFASSCENLPIILIEAMSAGLPIASSDRGPMPEVLKDAGYYFNPEDVDSIYKSLEDLYLSYQDRYSIANKAYFYTNNFTWANCSTETFDFLAQIAKTTTNEK
ncbi:Glycosyltransferase Gtf1 [compost metagenome]